MDSLSSTTFESVASRENWHPADFVSSTGLNGGVVFPLVVVLVLALSGVVDEACPVVRA